MKSITKSIDFSNDEEDDTKSTTFVNPTIKIETKKVISNDMTWNSFTNIQHLTDSSNANIYIGYYNKQKVIIKIIKEECLNNPVAVTEFVDELQLLSKISHKNIIKVFGSGEKPRKFLVLELLLGGTLSSVLTKAQKTTGLFKKPAFTYAKLLEHARDMADAFDYLHQRCQTGACIIHRGNFRTIQCTFLGMSTSVFIKSFNG